MTNRPLQTEEELERAIENTILIWSTEITGQQRDKLKPDALTLVDRLVEIITQRDVQWQARLEQAVLEGKIEENKRWLTVLAPSMDENVAYNSDFHDRITELQTPIKSQGGEDE